MDKLNFITSLKRGTGTNVITITVPTMRKTNNPYIGRVKKITTYSGVQLGTSFENSVNNCVERSGSTTTFTSEKPNGKHYINDFVLQNDKDESTLYLQIQYSELMLQKNIVKIKSIYLIDEHEASEAELVDINSFMNKKVLPKKQIEAGVDLDKLRYYISPKLDNVIAIKQGNAIWDEMHIL